MWHTHNPKSTKEQQSKGVGLSSRRVAYGQPPRGYGVICAHERQYAHLQFQEPQTQLWLFNTLNGVETWGQSLNKENNLEKDLDRPLVSMIGCMKTNKASIP